MAFAGVPVSDLIARMGYHTQSYRDLYETEYHIGKSANDNVQEYRRRSPVWNTHKFDGTPLLIHTNTNDDDVNILEVEHIIKSLKAEGLPSDYETFEALPGGHSFDRMDTKTGKEIRVKIHKHLVKILKPEKPFKALSHLQKAAYKFQNNASNNFTYFSKMGIVILFLDITLQLCFILVTFNDPIKSLWLIQKQKPNTKYLLLKIMCFTLAY